MKRGRAAARARRRALAIVMALAVVGSAVAPVAPSPGRVALAQDEGSGTIVHSADGVLLREEPTFGAEVLETMPQGTRVGLRTMAADTVYDPDGVTQWWPVSTGDADGWVAGFYLQIDNYDQPVAAGADESVAAEPTASRGGVAPADDQWLATWDLANAAAQVAEPEGVNLREDPTAQSPTVRALSYKTVVDLRVDEVDTVYSEGSRWWPVRVDGLVGWVSGSYLAPTEVWTGDTSGSEQAASADSVPSKVADFFQAGSYVAAATDDGAGVNIRADGAPDAERIGIVPESDVVQVMDGPTYDPIGNPWYLITDGSVTGFVSGQYLSRADQPGADLASSVIPSKVSTPGVASGALEYPLSSYTFTQGFGCSPYYFEPWSNSAGCNFHNGIDLAAPSYTPIMAADGGTVEYSGWCDCGLGYYVKIDHGNGFETLYGHMAEQPWVYAGESVAKGDIIGPVGSTGMSTGPHVHFIVDYNGVDQDPLGYLP
jgi:murein DD-endopeptidase MepM/ murein hydrolase activator NlpD